MTEQITTRFPQFFLTPPAPCPYLPGRLERKVFTHLRGQTATPLNEALTHAGFRRSQNIAYRPACDGCNACVSVRILVDAFEPGRTFRKVINRNQALSREIVEPWAREDQFALLQRYLTRRHPGGGMSDMTMLDFVAMVEDTPVDSHLVEYRMAPAEGERTGRLAACALTDVLSDGLSMVYSFFDPEFDARGLGTYMVLDHVEQARALGLPYVYLGYWVAGCRKMSYKIRFEPLEALGPSGWQRLRTP